MGNLTFLIECVCTFYPQFVVMEVFLVGLYFVTFDNADMRPEEEINIPAIVNQLTDPEIVTRNIVANFVITAGTVRNILLQSISLVQLDFTSKN